MVAAHKVAVVVVLLIGAVWAYARRSGLLLKVSALVGALVVGALSALSVRITGRVVAVVGPTGCWEAQQEFVLLALFGLAVGAVYVGGALLLSKLCVTMRSRLAVCVAGLVVLGMSLVRVAPDELVERLPVAEIRANDAEVRLPSGTLYAVRCSIERCAIDATMTGAASAVEVGYTSPVGATGWPGHSVVVRRGADFAVVEFPDRHVIRLTGRSLLPDYYSSERSASGWFAPAAIALGTGGARSLFLSDFGRVGPPRWISIAGIALVLLAIAAARGNASDSSWATPMVVMLAVAPVLLFYSALLLHHRTPLLWCA